MTEDDEYNEIFSRRMVQNTAGENVRTKEEGRNRRMDKNVTRGESNFLLPTHY